MKLFGNTTQMGAMRTGMRQKRTIFLRENVVGMKNNLYLCSLKYINKATCINLRSLSRANLVNLVNLLKSLDNLLNPLKSLFILDKN